MSKAGDLAYLLLRVAACTLTLYMAQVTLAAIPNTELVSFLIIAFTLAFGKETFATVTLFSIMEGQTYGFGMWTVSYFYVWPLLVLATLLLKNVIKNDTMLWAVVSGGFGLIFGALFALPYLFTSPSFALSYWVTGLPWDVWHALCNAVIMASVGTISMKIQKKLGGKPNGI